MIVNPERKNLIIDEDFEKALHYLEDTNESIFLTGKAGTGKSTVVNYWREVTKKEHIILAPTGRAATLVGGQTIHSFFKLPFGILDKDEIRDLMYNQVTGLDTIQSIIIDESSMIRCDIIDAIDSILRAQGKERDKPFGGMQMIFVGDLFQLPPVLTENDKEYFNELYVSPFFFNANVFDNFSLKIIELKKVHRQSGDMAFLEILERVRNDNVTTNDLKTINAKYDPFIEDDEEFCLTITTTNKKADEINQAKLNELTTKKFTVYATTVGKFPLDSLPTDEVLSLKIGAQIILIKNDASQRFYNGSLGKVLDFVDDKILVQVQNIDGYLEDFKIGKETWLNIKYEFDASSKRMKRRTIGEFTQYPIKLAYAITIHKVQGGTYNKIRIHLGKGCFSPGQFYVAISRIKSLDGLRLLNEVRRRDIFTDKGVLEFISKAI